MDDVMSALLRLGEKRQARPPLTISASQRRVDAVAAVEEADGESKRHVVVELHVPLPLTTSAEPLTWIESMDEYLGGLQQQGDLRIFGDSEEEGRDYVFPITGAPESVLIEKAGEVWRRAGSPSGAFVIVTDDVQDENSPTRRVPLQ